jgi:hypothetical protein
LKGTKGARRTRWRKEAFQRPVRLENMKRGSPRDQTRLQEAGNKHKTERSTRQRIQRGVSGSVKAQLSRETGVELRKKKAKVQLKQQEPLRDVQARQDETSQGCDGLKAPRMRVQMG